MRLGDLAALPVESIDLLVLKQAGLIPEISRSAKVILAGEINRAINVSGVLVTKGAKQAIESAGGTVKSFEA